MASLGRIEPYDGNSGLDVYLERVELYYIANNIGSVSSDASESSLKPHGSWLTVRKLK